MKVHTEIEQGSEAWFRIRVGKITASNASKIITPKTMKPSASQEDYMNHILAELFYEQPLDTFSSEAMERGVKTEAEAAQIYCVENDCELERIGFVTNDAETIGCSPDRFIVGQKKAVEIKVPLPKTHVAYLRTKAVDRDYWAQLQFQLWICELEKVDIYSYNPKMPRVQIEVLRDEEFIKKAGEYCAEFLDRLNEQRKYYGI